jgi:hypothetical protein
MLKYVLLPKCSSKYRGIAQLVEQRSPKPRVQSSSLCAPASGALPLINPDADMRSGFVYPTQISALRF